MELEEKTKYEKDRINKERSIKINEIKKEYENKKNQKTEEILKELRGGL